MQSSSFRNALQLLIGKGEARLAMAAAAAQPSQVGTQVLRSQDAVWW